MEGDERDEAEEADGVGEEFDGLENPFDVFFVFTVSLTLAAPMSSGDFNVREMKIFGGEKIETRNLFLLSFFLRAKS